MIPVEDLIASLSLLADDGDEDAAQRVNTLATAYPPDVLKAARARQDSLSVVHGTACAAPTAPAAPAPGETLGDILSAVMGGAEGPTYDWDLLQWVIDAAASHYGLHRDDCADALFDLECEYAENYGALNFGGHLKEPEGIATIAAAVAERVTGQTPTTPPLLLSYH